MSPLHSSVVRSAGFYVAASVLILAVLLSSASCGSDDGGLDESLADAITDASACQNFRVPSGFSLGWDSVVHTIALWEVVFEPVPEPGNGCETTGAQGGLLGRALGSQDDGAGFELDYQDVALAAESRVGVARVHLVDFLEGTSTGSGSVTLDRAAHNLRNYHNAVALLEGVSFNTNIPQSMAFPDDYDPAQGYSSRGFGIRVWVDSMSATEIELAYDIRFEPGVSDRPDMNEALLVANTRIEFDVLLVGASNTPVHVGHVRSRMTYADPQSVPGPLPRSPEAAQQITFHGTPGGDRGFHGLSAFDFSLDPILDADDGEMAAGHYMRAFSIHSELDERESETGRTRFLVEGFASNNGVVPDYFPLDHQFSATLVWVDTPSDVTLNRVTTEFDGGRRQVEFSTDE